MMTKIIARTRNDRRLWASGALLAALVALALPTASQAGVPLEEFEARFAYDAETDAETTYRRFKRVADKACGVRNGPQSVALRTERLRCRDDILDKAVAKTRSPVLAALHGGEVVPSMLASRKDAPRAVLSATTATAASGECDKGAFDKS